MIEEEYEVRLNYVENGHWVLGHKQMVTIEVTRKKVNHLQAQREAEKKFPGCQIISVTYI